MYTFAFLCTDTSVFERNLGSALPIVIGILTALVLGYVFRDVFRQRKKKEAESGLRKIIRATFALLVAAIVAFTFWFFATVFTC